VLSNFDRDFQKESHPAYRHAKRPSTSRRRGRGPLISQIPILVRPKCDPFRSFAEVPLTAQARQPALVSMPPARPSRHRSPAPTRPNRPESANRSQIAGVCTPRPSSQRPASPLRRGPRDRDGPADRRHKRGSAGASDRTPGRTRPGSPDDPPQTSRPRSARLPSRL
jgi:hypothetical protein